MTNETEIRYLEGLRRDRRTADLAGRLRDLRDAGYSIIEVAEQLGVTKQWLYSVLSKHPESRSSEDAPAVIPIENVLIPEQSIRADRAKLPHPLADGISALWRVAVRDRSAGLSPVANSLDVMLSLLTRRGVPSLAIAQDVGVTHRSVLMRLERARQRGTLPDDLAVQILEAPKYKERRTTVERIPGGEAFGVFQVVNSTFPRFYTMRDAHGEMLLVDPHRPPSDLDLEDVIFLHDEAAFSQVVYDALPDESEIYAAPAHWLYLDSTPKYLWARGEYLILEDFFPRTLVPSDPQVLTCLTDPKAVLKTVPAIDWSQNAPEAPQAEDSPEASGDRTVGSDSS